MEWPLYEMHKPGNLHKPGQLLGTTMSTAVSAMIGWLLCILKHVCELYVVSVLLIYMTHISKSKWYWSFNIIELLIE